MARPDVGARVAPVGGFMSFLLEFADSEVSAVTSDGDTLLVRFSAAAVIDAAGTTGFLKSVELVFGRATWQGHLAACFGRVSEGWLVSTCAPVRRVPVPCASDAAHSAELQFRNGEVLVIQSKSVTVRLDGSSRFFESHAC